MKRILGLLLVIMLVVSMAGCGSTTQGATASAAASESVAASESAAPEATPEATPAASAEATPAAVYPAEKVLIGVELYDPTESETLEIQKYFAYLSENFNVEFKYSEAIADADGEMKFIEDCAVAGCKGFFGYYNVTGVEQVNKALELGMVYYGGTTQIYEEFKNEPKYLGIVRGNGSDYEAGKALGQWVIDQGYTNVVYANGGADFGVPLFVDRQKGFLEAIGDKVKVVTVSGFPGDQFFASQAAALATEGLQAVVASFNGVDFWAQPIASAGLKDVKLATLGAINDSYLKAFHNNQLSFLVAGNIQANGFAVTSILNAVDGNADKVRDNGVALNYQVPTFIVNKTEEIEKILAVQTEQKIFSAEDLKKTIVSLNPAATAQTIKALADSGSKEAVMGK